MTDDRLIRIQGDDPVNARYPDPDKDRRERYAAALREAIGPVGVLLMDTGVLADAAIAVADDDIRSAVSHVVDENARLREQLDQLRGQLDTARAVTNRETEENARLRAELEESREECRIARRREVRYNRDLDQAEATISRVRAVLGSMQNLTDVLNVRAALDITD